MAARPEFDSGEPGAAEPRRRSIVETWTEVVADAGGLVRAEAALARAETERNLKLIGRESAKIVIGGMLALMALVFLTIAAVVALSEFIGLLLALLVVAVLCLGAGWLLVSKGLDGVSGQPILPERVLKRMGRDLDLLADRAPLPEVPGRPAESGGVREAA
ncbi:phage holin family protein [Sandaracinobacter sp.]|uniref:phage holin family protein n=1 Tax=Sandaracinobacter sp. TaxID=2487581 RepID=UPI0035ADCE8C